MSLLFISHSTKDKQAARELRERLIAAGYDAKQLFLDSDAESGIEAGADWEERLYRRLGACPAVLVLCSNNWKQSKWCFAEMVHGKVEGKHVFPIYIEDCELEPMLSRFQAIFLFRDPEEGYRRLFSALENAHLGPRDSFTWDENQCPFPGMPAFDASMAGVYFGREPETREVLEQLARMRDRGVPRLLMIVGGSGSGKSSLLRAGPGRRRTVL